MSIAEPAEPLRFNVTIRRFGGVIVESFYAAEVEQRDNLWTIRGRTESGEIREIVVDNHLYSIELETPLI